MAVAPGSGSPRGTDGAGWWNARQTSHPARGRGPVRLWRGGRGAAAEPDAEAARSGADPGREPRGGAPAVRSRRGGRGLRVPHRGRHQPFQRHLPASAGAASRADPQRSPGDDHPRRTLRRRADLLGRRASRRAAHRAGGVSPLHGEFRRRGALPCERSRRSPQPLHRRCTYRGALG